MILVIGADGLLGSALLCELRSTGHPALGTSRRGTPGFAPLDLVSASRFEPPQDTRLAFLCAGMDSLAACDRDPQGTAAINVDATIALAKKLAARGIPLVFPSSNYAALPCEYGLQKAAVESASHGPLFASVRLPKILETLRPRFLEWAQSLDSGREIHASPVLRFAPVLLAEATAGLASFASDFRPGLFEAIPDASFSHHEAAVRLALALNRPANSVRKDDAAGLSLFRGTLPSFDSPPDSSFWKFSPASQILDAFVSAIAAGVAGR
ncbi:MAG: sugar nucleotide-binding protein [Verrucomicrobiota bacterium]